MEGHIVNLIPMPDTNEGKPLLKMVGKFIIIRYSGELIMICGLLAEFPYHANLVERYCTDNEVASTWIKRPDVHEIFDSDYAVQGGGWIEVDHASKHLKLFGKSTAYGACKRGDLNDLITSDPTFAGYSVTSV